RDRKSPVFVSRRLTKMTDRVQGAGLAVTTMSFAAQRAVEELHLDNNGDHVIDDLDARQIQSVASRVPAPLRQAFADVQAIADRALRLQTARPGNNRDEAKSIDTSRLTAANIVDLVARPDKIDGATFGERLRMAQTLLREGLEAKGLRSYRGKTFLDL